VEKKIRETLSETSRRGEYRSYRREERNPHHEKEKGTIENKMSRRLRDNPEKRGEVYYQRLEPVSSTEKKRPTPIAGSLEISTITLGVLRK